MSDINNTVLSYTEEDLNLFKSYYMTNENCYAEQLLSKKEGKATWVKREGNQFDFTEALREHFLGKKTIGAYSIILTGKYADHCKNCTFDFDLTQEQRKQLKKIKNPDEREILFKSQLEDLQNSVRDFVLTIQKVGVKQENILVSFSGYKGYHVDLFFETPIPAKIVYEFAHFLKAYANIGAHIEVFPKQPSAGNQYGSLVKLPLGIHRGTSRRAIFVDLFNTDESLFGTQFDFLRRTIKISEAELHNIRSDIAEININVHTYSDTEEIKDLTQPPTCASLTKMFSSCNALKRLVEKAKNEHHLLHEERLALLMLCIHFGEEGRAKLHEIMKNCSDYSEKETEKMYRHAKDEKKYKPILCSKLQFYHICRKTCSAILERNGRSPIKLAYEKAKVDAHLSLLEDIERTQYVNKTISVPFKVASLVGGTYSIPKEVIFTCKATCPERDPESGKCLLKTKCKANKPYKIKYIVDKDSEIILSLLDLPMASIKKILISLADIPCIKPNNLIMEPKTYHYIQPMIITSADEVLRNQVFDSKSLVELKAYLAYFNGDNINVSTDYIGTGKIYPNPKNQKTTILFHKVERMMGNLDDFSPNEEQLEHLNAYKKIDKNLLLQEFTDRICGIRGRYKETQTALLTILSPLQIDFNGRRLERGWLESLFIGDSAQGKSHIPETLLKYAGVCNMISGGNASVVGIIGGVDSYDKERFVSWGIMPNSDRTILFIDELEKLQEKAGAMSALREVRSRGKAVITKVKKGTKMCRVRLIASANPKKGTSIASYKRGCLALNEVLEPPDIRRFDIVQFFFKEDVTEDQIMKEVLLEDKSFISKEMIKTMILWAWTRSADDIKFTREVTREILLKAKELFRKYGGASESVPLVTSDIHEKLARITASMAMYNCRTHDFVTLYPTIEDVNAAFKLLDDTYSSPNVALDEEAIECVRKNEVQVSYIEKFRHQMVKHKISPKIDPIEVIAHLSTISKVRGEELAFFLGCSRGDANNILQLLQADAMVVFEYGSYSPTAKLWKLTRLLRQKNGIRIENQTRPAFFDKKEEGSDKFKEALDALFA